MHYLDFMKTLLALQLTSVPPDRIAAIVGQHTYTYRDLVEAMHDRSQEYRRAGIRSGNVVGLQSPNTWDFLSAHAALAALGAVTATLHQPLTEGECHALMAFVGARHWIRHSQVTSVGDSLETADRPEGESLESAEWPLAIFFTSGTQSLMPKPCLHSHQTLLGNARAVAQDAGMDAQDRFISASPFTHLFGILSCHLAWVLGAAQILIEHFRPQDFLDQAVRHEATVAFMVPTHLRDLLGYLQEHPQASKGLKLREVRVAGAAVSPDLAARTDQHLGARLVNHWGMSEIGGGTYTHWQDAVQVASNSIGRHGTGVAIMLLDADGQVIVAPGQPAEMLFRGPSLFYGYYNNPSATSDALYQDAKGQWWLKTGDLASWDDDGRLQYRGRLKDIINRGGMKVDALEIEHAVMTIPGVHQAALVAVPDARLGERATLVVELEPGATLTLEHIKEHLRQLDIAKFKWPERLEVWDRLPTTPTGKLAKARIREALQPTVKDTAGPDRIARPNGR
ncbi:long-chain fatty acid--CoA ligase [Sulfobacillus sp. DSM 109850]|uniref:Long-chain fatty acid--CoA ligase n=1 Tax=Sulfobacillus harzensis TaxID=2729629 RepID=A0A7Y0L600_9FIRM|nr:long-chain fatty acid--CoA ligase [Sulfobacillus harzensis]